MLGFLDLFRTLDSHESGSKGCSVCHKTSCFVYAIIAVLLSALLSSPHNDLHIKRHVEFANANCSNRSDSKTMSKYCYVQMSSDSTISENKWKVGLLSMQCSRLAKGRCFLKVPRLHPSVLLVRATCRWRWVWSIGGMILTGRERSTSRKTCPSVCPFTTNLKWTASEWKTEFSWTKRKDSLLTSQHIRSLHCQRRSINAVTKNRSYLFWSSFQTCNYTVWRTRGLFKVALKRRIWDAIRHRQALVSSALNGCCQRHVPAT